MGSVARRSPRHERPPAGPAHEELSRARPRRLLDFLGEDLDQIGHVLNKRLGEDLQLAPILVKAVPVDTVVAQYHCLEEALLVTGGVQNADPERDVVEDIYLRQVMIQ